MSAPEALTRNTSTSSPSRSRGAGLQRGVAAAVQDQLADRGREAASCRREAPGRARCPSWRRARRWPRRHASTHPLFMSALDDRLGLSRRRSGGTTSRCGAAGQCLSLSPTFGDHRLWYGGGGTDGGAGAGCGASALAVGGAGSRTVERRRGGSGCARRRRSGRSLQRSAGSLDGAGATDGGAASRSATASLSSALGRRRSGQFLRWRRRCPVRLVAVAVLVRQPAHLRRLVPGDCAGRRGGRVGGAAARHRAAARWSVLTTPASPGSSARSSADQLAVFVAIGSPLRRLACRSSAVVFVTVAAAHECRRHCVRASPAAPPTSAVFRRLAGGFRRCRFHVGLGFGLGLIALPAPRHPRVRRPPRAGRRWSRSARRALWLLRAYAPARRDRSRKPAARRWSHRR